MHILYSANGSLKVENWYLSYVHEICSVKSSAIMYATRGKIRLHILYFISFLL